jgi:hypothetical protein
MCEFFSAIYTKQGKLLYNLHLDSHEDIVALYNLRDNSDTFFRQNFARVEFVPDHTKDITKPDAWTLRLDETNTLDWWDHEKAAEKCWEVIKKIIITDYRRLLVGGVYILANEAKIDKIINANVREMWDSSQVGEMRGFSQVGEMRDSSQVGVMCGSSQVGVMYNSSQVREMWGFSQVGVMRDSSQVGEMRGSSQVGVMRDSSQVGEMRDSSQVGVMCGSSAIKNDRRGK